jgi:hypothetical protein
MEGQCVSCEVRRGACMLFQISFRFQRINFYFVIKCTLQLIITPLCNYLHCLSGIRAVIV